MIETTKLMASLKELNGTAIASIDSKTTVKLTGGKKNPHQGRIEKVSEKSNIMLFCNGKSNSYENMVKKRLTKEGKNPDTFKLGKRAWGIRVPQSPLVVHKDNVYMEAIFLNPPKNTFYLLDGQPIDKADIEGLPKPKPATQGGLNDTVQIRTYNLKSISAFRCGELSVI